MKTTTSITIDIDLLQKSKLMKINVSKLVNNVLKGVIISAENSDIDILSIEKRLDELKEQMTVLKTEEQELLTEKMAYEERKQAKEDKDLKQRIKMSKAIKSSGLL